VAATNALKWVTPRGRDFICWSCVKRLVEEWPVSPAEDATCERCGESGDTRLIGSIGWKVCGDCMSVAADCLSPAETPPNAAEEPGQIRFGTPRRSWTVWLRCHYQDRTEDRQVVITERDAQMDMGQGPVASRAFSVYENGVILGDEVSPIDFALTLEGVEVWLAELFDCERVEQVASLETGPV